MTKRRDEQKYDYLVKLVLIGDTAVGKTNILLRYVNEEYKMSHITTIGVDFKIKTVNIEGVKIKMQIWDTAGQERFKTITETYYRGAAGVVLVYSITDRKTFHNMENWIKQINETQPETMCKLIVGNKADCKESERQVTYEQGRNLAAKYGVEFIESSAKENTNITQIFQTIGRQIQIRLLEADSQGATQGGGAINIGNNKGKPMDKKCQC